MSGFNERMSEESLEDDRNENEAFDQNSATAPGAFVRVTRKQQAEIEAENLEQAERFNCRTSVIPKQVASFSWPQQQAVSLIPSTTQLYRATLRRATSSYTDEEIAQFSVDEAMARIERIDEAWRKFETDWLAMGHRQLSEEQLSECTAFFAEAEEEFLTYKSKLCGQLKRFTSSASVTSSIGGQAIQIQLTEAPKVPKFSGLETDWANFRAIYEAEVHNSQKFSDAQKMRYLLGALQGRAEQIYRNWPIGDGSSYKQLWSEIGKQYGNEYNTIRAHLQTLATLKPLQQPTCDSVRKLLDAARNAFRQLQLLLKPEEVGEHMLLHKIEGMLDADSRVQWSVRRSVEELPTLTEMFRFLELRASLLSQMSVASAGGGTQSSGAAQSSVALKTFNERVPNLARGDESRPKCELCPGQYHWPFRCAKFLSLPLQERLAYVTKQNRCINCFSSRHQATKCSDRQCPRCREKHNSVLCPANDNAGGPPSKMRRLQQDAGSHQTIGKQVAANEFKQ